MTQALNYEQHEVIEAAYWAGFEPSSDSLTLNALFTEAQNFLTNTVLTF